MLKEGKLKLCLLQVIGGFGVVTQMVLMLALLSGRVIPSPQLPFQLYSIWALMNPHVKWLFSALVTSSCLTQMCGQGNPDSTKLEAEAGAQAPGSFISFM